MYLFCIFNKILILFIILIKKMSMSNLSTNDVSYIESKISIPKYLKNIKDTLTRDFDNVPIIYYDDEEENKNPLFEYIDFCDKENGNNS